MEASALPRSAQLPRPRLVVPAPLLRLRSDDQLVALFRAGSDDAFRTIHDRYRVRLLAYARQMLSGSTADAEDALQEVFVRAHAALLASSTPISLRAWLYRIAHNRCIDQLRRPSPIPSEIMPGAEPALSPGHRHDPPIEAERREDFLRLVSDVHQLPEQQRSALLMRELQGLSYEELAVALGISVAAVKSVLLRARGGVLDAAEARDAPCAEIRLELVSAHDRGVRASGRARRHMRECDHCCSYRGELRAIRREVAGLVPVGPLGHLGLLFGIGGGGAGAGGGLAAGGTSAVLGGAATVTATKVAALVCCAALIGTSGALRTGGSHHRTATGHGAPAARHTATVAPRVVARAAGGAIAPPPAPAERSVPHATTPPASTGPSEPPLTGQDSYATSGAADGSTGTLGLTAANVGPPTQAAASPAGGVSAPDATAPDGSTAATPADPATTTPATAAQTAAAAASSTATATPASTTSTAGTATTGTATDDGSAAPLARVTMFHGAFHHRTLHRRISFSRGLRGTNVEPQPLVTAPVSS
jgi:RNA polymerase sigma factor (sigma-70 family)